MKRWVCIIIFLLALALRTYNLNLVPPSPSLDEVSIGYNAFSILRTGVDEYGQRFPILLRAYDDWRPGLYVYFVIPFVWVFGLTSIAVRFPSVILSMMSIFAIWKIGSMIGKKYLNFLWLGECGALILAISPWHIYLSRLGHEVNLGAALLIIGIYFLLNFVAYEKRLSLLASGVLFGLSFHGYQSEKIITPLIVCCSLLFFLSSLSKYKKTALITLLIFTLISWPAVQATLSPQGLIRLKGTSAFAQSATKFEKLHVFTTNYVSHFSPTWLFMGSTRESHKVPGMGLMHFWELLLLLVGLYALLQLKIPKNFKYILILFILVSPVPAALTTQAPHAMRVFTLVMGFSIIESFGMYYILTKTRQGFRPLVAALFIVLVALGLRLFWNGYFVRFPIEQSDSFQYATKTAFEYANRVEHLYSSIEVSHKHALFQSYMFYLYYTRFDPELYQKLGGTKSGGYDQYHKIGSFSFGYLPDSVQDLKYNTLYLYDISSVPPGANVIEKFTNKDGSSAIVAVLKPN